MITSKVLKRSGEVDASYLRSAISDIEKGCSSGLLLRKNIRRFVELIYGLENAFLEHKNKLYDIESDEYQEERLNDPPRIVSASIAGEWNFDLGTRNSPYSAIVYSSEIYHIARVPSNNSGRIVDIPNPDSGIYTGHIPDIGLVECVLSNRNDGHHEITDFSVFRSIAGLIDVFGTSFQVDNRSTVRFTLRMIE